MTERTRIAAAAAMLLALAACEPSPAPSTASPSPGPAGVRYLASGSGDDAGFARATTPRRFEFPADHGSHPGYRTEWWYFTGNLFDAKHRAYGFELTIFRVALAAGAAPRESSLATDSVWMGNLAVTDTPRKRFSAAERVSRGAPGLAGADVLDKAAGEPIVVRVEDWSARIAGKDVHLEARDADFGVDLDLAGLDHIVLQGEAGLDAKGLQPGNASYYYSAPRLDAKGEIWSGGDEAIDVEGTAWMDREWSTSALSPDLAGWDWFALELDDGRDLMFYRLRGRDGSTSPFSSGSITDTAGEPMHLDSEDVSLRIAREWTSPATGVRYPVAWRLAIPKLDLDLEVTPRLDAQELDLSVRYWEGAVRVAGESADKPVGGFGYLELAGY